MHAHKPNGLGCLTTSQAIPKFWTHNLVCRPMHVSDWPKRPNMVPRPNLGSDSVFHLPPWSTPKAKAYSHAPTLGIWTPFWLEPESYRLWILRMPLKEIFWGFFLVCDWSLKKRRPSKKKKCCYSKLMKEEKFEEK